MIIKYAPEIRDEVEMCRMIKDSIDDEKVSWQKQFDLFSMRRPDNVEAMAVLRQI